MTEYVKNGLIQKSKKESKDQESIQSSTTADPRYQWESDNFTTRYHKLEPRVSPFLGGDHKASIDRRAQKHNKTRQKKNMNDPQKKHRLGTDN